jgi:hypothetical protein
VSENILLRRIFKDEWEWEAEECYIMKSFTKYY